MSDRPFPGDIRQVGHVVADLDAAMAEWLALGVGPWTVIEVDQPGSYRGEPGRAATRIGFSHDGPMQLELIEAVGEGRSVWHEARDAGRFGPHHIAYWADDFDVTAAAVDRAGLVVVQDGDGNGMARFVYVETPNAMLIEIMELTEICGLFMDGIREACETWDGETDPIRR